MRISFCLCTFFAIVDGTAEISSRKRGFEEQGGKAHKKAPEDPIFNILLEDEIFAVYQRTIRKIDNLTDVDKRVAAVEEFRAFVNSKFEQKPVASIFGEYLDEGGLLHMLYLRAIKASS
jgi:hypothetical protein